MSRPSRIGSWLRRLLLLLVALAAAFGVLLREQGTDLFTTSSLSTSEAAGEAAILEAYAQRQSGQMVELNATVHRMLSDDQEGSRHQRFILALSDGHTVLVAHNIDLAPRVPVQVGDVVRVRAQYEWNEQGGVLHWTHHDPGGRRPGGWVEHRGERYR